MGYFTGPGGTHPCIHTHQTHDVFTQTGSPTRAGLLGEFKTINSSNRVVSQCHLVSYPGDQCVWVVLNVGSL